jgi:hypothetical protein
MPRGQAPGSKAKRYPELPPTHRPTKPVRLTLPVELAEAWETMSKEQRDNFVAQALRSKAATGS